MASETVPDAAVAKAVRAKVAHHCPGRMRLQVERGADVHEVARRLETTVSDVKGVHRVEVRAATRSVVVHYSPTELELADLLDRGVTGAAVELLEEGARSAARTVGRTSVGRHLVNAVGVANGGLERATGGVIGLRDAFPLTLLGLGLRDVLRGTLEPVPWYNLLYWGYATFAELHGRRNHGPVGLDPRDILARRYATGELTRHQFREMLAELDASGVGRAQPDGPALEGSDGASSP